MFCAFSGVTRMSQLVGYARNKLQFDSVLQNLKSSLLMQAYAWIVFSLSLFRISWLKYFIPFRTRLNNIRDPGKPVPITKPNMHNSKQLKDSNKTAFCCKCHVECHWGQWISMNMITKSRRDMFTDAQSCSWLVMRSNHVGLQSTNQIH